MQFYTSTNLFCSLQKFLGALFVMFAEKIVSTNDIYWVNFVCCAWHWLAAMGPRNMYVIQNRNPIYKDILLSKLYSHNLNVL